MPTSDAQDKKLDENNANAWWMGATNILIYSLKVTFDVLEDRAKIPVDCNEVSGRLFFDTRVTLERKAALV